MGQSSDYRLGVWYAIRSATCREAAAVASLKQLKIEHYMATRKNWSWHAGSKHKVSRPLIPGYIFVKIDRRDDFPRVSDAEGVHAFVKGTADRYAQVPAEWVALIQRAERLNLFDHTVPRRSRLKLDIGDRVKITGTSFIGRLATVIELIKQIDKQGNETVKGARVELQAMGISKFDIAMLERAA